jgi:clumping factor A
MIVVSVLLILVAVALLVLGLAGGSSTLLISSIVASLLAAVALVIGARQAATVRRAAGADPTVPGSRATAGRPAAAQPIDVDLDAGAPMSDPPVATGSATSGSTAAGFGAGLSAAETAAAAAAPGRRGGRRREPDPDPSFADNPPAADEGLASPMDAKPRVANRDDAESALAADAAYREAAEPYADAEAGYPEPEAAPADADRAYRDLDSALGDGTPASEGSDDEAGPDYDRASSFIGGARSETGSNSWRRAHANDTLGDEDDGSGLAEEFGEPDIDDPDDEPLPEAVRPVDAVTVARMTTEVQVVDGRPRYHLSDCLHLAGRSTEPLSVSEAVELGFSPCGLCRPVGHLVAQAARR